MYKQNSARAVVSLYTLNNTVSHGGFMSQRQFSYVIEKTGYLCPD